MGQNFLQILTFYSIRIISPNFRTVLSPMIKCNIKVNVHSSLCLTTCPYTLRNLVLYRVRSSASILNFQCPLFSLRLPSSCLLLLPRLPFLQPILSFYLSFKYESRIQSHEQLVLHANWEQQTKESAVVDGTSCCIILECLVTSIA